MILQGNNIGRGSNLLDRQESFWHGAFGKLYTERSQSNDLLEANEVFFKRALAMCQRPESVLELGANVGLNLSALERLFPEQRRVAVEINSSAYAQLAVNPAVSESFNSSILSAAIVEKFDLVFTKGVLIHLNPESLVDVYNQIASWSKRYVLFAEYYNPTPVEVEYHSEKGVLFKRDFAGEFLTMHSDFRLLDYGFSYRGDLNPSQDDITWFLMEK